MVYGEPGRCSWVFIQNPFPDLLELLFRVSPGALLWVWLAVNRKWKTEVRQPSSPLLTSSLGAAISIQPTPVPSSVEGNMEKDFTWSYRTEVTLWSDGKREFWDSQHEPKQLWESVFPSALCSLSLPRHLCLLCPSPSSQSRLRNSFLWIRWY